MAYSKICTHVGCPVALYEQHTHHLLCPCHQSTFDVRQNCKVIFGPAERPLPQLPITVDDEGYLVGQERLPRARRAELLGARMSTTSAKATAAADLGNFVDERVGASKGVKFLARKIFPDHWSFMLGRGRALQLHHPAAQRRLPDLLLRAQRRRDHLPRFLRTAERRRRSRRRTPPPSGCPSTSAAGCWCARSTTGRPCSSSRRSSCTCSGCSSPERSASRAS